MPKGGARSHSGPAPDPMSERSERRGIRFTALPALGYDGDVPDFPLPPRRVYRWETEDKRRFQVYDEEATELVTDRELALWADRWSTPQACAWAQPSERWRHHSIAMWVRTAVLCESGDATAADRNSLHRFADDIGLTPAGLRVNGWSVAVDELAAKAADTPTASTPVAPRRLRSADAQ